MRRWQKAKVYRVLQKEKFIPPGKMRKTEERTSEFELELLLSEITPYFALKLGVQRIQLLSAFIF